MLHSTSEFLQTRVPYLLAQQADQFIRSQELQRRRNTQQQLQALRHELVLESARQLQRQQQLHDQQLQALRHALELESARQLQRQQQFNAQQLRELRQELEVEAARQIRQQQQTSAQELQTLREDHRQELENIQRGHQEELHREIQAAFELACDHFLDEHVPSPPSLTPSPNGNAVDVATQTNGIAYQNKCLKLRKLKNLLENIGFLSDIAN